jgi:hypothetical protein
MTAGGRRGAGAKLDDSRQQYTKSQCIQWTTAFNEYLQSLYGFDYIPYAGASTFYKGALCTVVKAYMHIVIVQCT